MEKSFLSFTQNFSYQRVHLVHEVVHVSCTCVRNEKHVQYVDIKQIKKANHQERKQVIIVKSVICIPVKIVLKNLIPAVKYNTCFMLKEKTIEFVRKFDYAVQKNV